ncbi:MAG TPA: class I SAM-dependent methyltransferase [Trebonia sp.]|nr:class I SAM-dependent methyltransferase [Trebonia sp.]
MQDGVASRTARSVAARRLSFERVPADYGDPTADLALSADVAAGLVPAAGSIHDYIRARTAFFDRVVVGALGRGIEQVVVGAAGYDGRSLRYAKPGVHWFEVDHPATQADKRERITRLGLDTSHVRFIAADFTADPVAGPLLDAGLDPGEPALFLYEGIAVYLSKEVNESVLAQFRSVTADGGLLAISMSLARAARSEDSRADLHRRLAAAGEPAKSVLEPGEAIALLVRAGWQVADPAAAQDPGRQARLQLAGLLTAYAASLPQPERSLPPFPPTASLSHPVLSLPAVSQSAVSQPAVPLPVLLSRAIVAFTIEADNEAEHTMANRTSTHGLAPGAAPGAPWLISLAMWASSLRLIPDEGTTVARLRQLARTGSNLAGLRRWGYVTFQPEPTRGKQPSSAAMILLTANGRAARDGWAPIAGHVEQRWRERFGSPAVAALRSALTAVAAELPAGLPDCLPILGYGLLSRISPDMPASGTASVVSDLPLWALLSRVLVAFAAEFENAAGASLAIAANVLRVLTEGGVRQRDVPMLSGVSKEAVAMAMGILTKRGLAREGKDPAGGRWRVAQLTPAGLLAQDAYRERVASIEDAWRSRLGADVVARLRSSLERFPPDGLLAGTHPYPECWRARLSPLTVLPHYPMVLHRGGFPDGS